VPKQKREKHASRKLGRNHRRPGQARRIEQRPDLYHKAKKIVQSCGVAFLKTWAIQRAERYASGRRSERDPMVRIYRILEKYGA
jgi:hypothetical protein